MLLTKRGCCSNLTLRIVRESHRSSFPILYRQTLLTCLPRSSSKTLNSPGDPSLASSGQHPDCSWIHLTNEPQSVSLLTNIRNPPHRDQNTLAFNQKYLIHLGKNIYKQLPTKYSQLNSCPLPDQQTNPKVLLLLFQISLKPLSRRWIEYLDIHWTITMRAL